MKQKWRCCLVFEAVFENDNGSRFVFGIRGGNFFAINIGEAVAATIGASQGFSQIGETLENMTVGSRSIDVSGTLFGNIVERKNALRSVCAPLSTGRLVLNGTHFIRVAVKAPPSFSAVKNNGLFKMQFYAPFPYFSAIKETRYLIGSITPMFRLPINYSRPHRFGSKSADRYANVINSGDVKAPFKMVIHCDGSSTNPVVTNLKTFEFVKFNGALLAGDNITLYRDNGNVLRAELARGGTVTDVISWLDDDSTLFDLYVGDNLLSVSDDQNGAGISVSISFNPVEAVLYET